MERIFHLFSCVYEHFAQKMVIMTVNFFSEKNYQQLMVRDNGLRFERNEKSKPMQITSD